MIYKVANFSDRARLQNGVNLTQLDPQELLRGPMVDFYLAVDDDESRATISVKLDGLHYGKRSRRQRQPQPRYIELPGFSSAFSAFQPPGYILTLEEKRRRIAHETDPEALGLE